jgi:hypothetical protein
MIRITLALLAIAAASLLPTAPAYAQIEYAYTPLDLDKCRHKPGKEVEDYGEWRCAGFSGIAVHVSAGDQRIYVSFGGNAAGELAAKQTLASFNGEGKTIEWRIDTAGGKKRPFATIMRWGTTVSGRGRQADARPGAGGDTARPRRRLSCRLCRWPRQSGCERACAQDRRRACAHIPLRPGQDDHARPDGAGLQRTL